MFESIKLFKNFLLEGKLFIVFNIIYFLNLIVDVNIDLKLIFAVILIIYLFINFKNIYKIEKYYLFYTFYLLLLFFIGISNNNFSSYIYYDILCFSSFLIILISFRYKSTAFNSSFFNNELPNIAFVLIILSFFFLLIYIYKFSFNIASIENGRGLDDLETKIMSPKYFLTSSLLFYPLKFYVSKKRKRIIFDISIIIFIFFSLAMSSRGTTSIAVIVFILTNLQIKNIKINFKILLNKKFIFMIVIAFFSLIVLYQIPLIRSAVDLLIYRFTVEGKLGEHRTLESSIIYNSLSFYELIFGKGLGAANTYWIFNNVPNGVNNVHYGYMFLILKGGILFLIFIYAKIIIKLISFLKSKELVPYGIILFSILLSEFSHTNFNSFYTLSFLFITLSASIPVKNQIRDEN
jgi:hypothetical protein